MLNRSRIIRSIVQAIVSILNIVLIVFCIQGLKETKANIAIYIKLIYIALCVIMIFVYTRVKKKLKEKVLNKNLIYVYRYSYLCAIIFASRIVMCYVSGLTFGGRMAAEMLVTLLNVILIKRIVFNISTSDMLSAIASIIYIFIPQVLFVEEMLFVLNFRLSLALAGIYLILKIIDEVSQKRLKNKKYIWMTVVLCICIILNMLFGGTSAFWILVVLMTLFASKTIDFTHMNFGQKFIDSIKSIKLKRLIYRLERININKLVIVLLITILVSVSAEFVINLINNDRTYLWDNIYNIKELYIRLNNLLRYSRGYYLTLLVITLICEIIGIILKRKVDLKTTVIRWTFVMTLINLVICKDLMYIYQIFDAILILNLILNISNIYYNREEKIKLLKDKN